MARTRYKRSNVGLKTTANAFDRKVSSLLKLSEEPTLTAGGEVALVWGSFDCSLLLVVVVLEEGEVVVVVTPWRTNTHSLARAHTYTS